MMPGVLKGVGVGARGPHLSGLLGKRRPDWLELLADNHFSPDGMKLAERLAHEYPIVLHCVGMNLGGSQGTSPDYLAKLNQLIERTAPILVSDHIALTCVDGHHHHDLWPVLRTTQVVAFVAQNIQRVQDALSRQLCVENISAYVDHDDNTLTEAEFIQQIVQRSGCGMLLDLNNLLLNAHNLRHNLEHALETLPFQSVKYIHVAGYTPRDKLWVDTHSCAPNEVCWSLLRRVLSMHPHLPTLIEWDNDLPTYDELLQEVELARHIAWSVHQEVAS